jgi:4-amino-4-deoxy-L-arabinose transferase-like glycosyltransferase
MQQLKKSPFLWYILAGIGILALFLLTRLLHLTNIPIFTDEAIYLRWAQIGLGDPRWRFISLVDGKQPLLIWLFYPALKLITDPLVAGRLVSVIAGFFGMLGIGIFGWYLTKSVRAGLIVSFLYVVIPFFMVYDRLAVYDGFLVALAVWSLFLTYLLAKTQRLDVAILLGTVVGAGLLTKSSANFFWYLLPLTLLQVDWKKSHLKKQIAIWIGLNLVVIVQSQIYNTVLYLSEFHHTIAEKNLSFIYSFSEIIKDPFRAVWGNLHGLTGWLVGYLTIPVAVLALISMVWFLRKDFKKAVFFSSFFFIPFLGLAFFGKVIYPRFILFMIPALLIMIMLFVENLLTRARSSFFIIILILVFLPAAWFEFKLLTDPIHAPLPSADRQQLINDWPAGYGINEVVAYIHQAAVSQPVILGTEGTFGLYPMALELYLGKDPNVTVKPYWPVSEVPPELLQLAKTKPVFLVFKERQDIPSSWPLELIAQYQRGDGPTYLKFYRVIPKS